MTDTQSRIFMLATALAYSLALSFAYGARWLLDHLWQTIGMIAAYAVPLGLWHGWAKAWDGRALWPRLKVCLRLYAAVRAPWAAERWPWLRRRAERDQP